VKPGAGGSAPPDNAAADAADPAASAAKAEALAAAQQEQWQQRAADSGWRDAVRARQRSREELMTRLVLMLILVGVPALLFLAVSSLVPWWERRLPVYVAFLRSWWEQHRPM
jgi:hypothetical protein